MFLRRLQGFWRMGGSQPYCVHGILPVTRICEKKHAVFILWCVLINYDAQNIQNL
jgi:hypothetical protein